MPISYRWDAARRFLRTTMHGHVTDVDLSEHVACIVHDPAITAPVRELVDLSAAERVDFSAARLQQLAAAAASHGDRFAGMRTAVVAPTDASFGLGRMYELLADSLASPITVAVFRTTEQAEAWLQERDATS